MSKARIRFHREIAQALLHNILGELRQSVALSTQRLVTRSPERRAELTMAGMQAIEEFTRGVRCEPMEFSHIGTLSKIFDQHSIDHSVVLCDPVAVMEIRPTLHDIVKTE